MRPPYRPVVVLAVLVAAALSLAAQQVASLPSAVLHYGDFTIQFRPDLTVAVRSGEGWDFDGTWTSIGTERLEIRINMGNCDEPARYGYRVEGGRIHLTALEDPCAFRRLLLTDTIWRPEGEAAPVAPRRIVVTPGASGAPLPPAASAEGSWPAFRGPGASGVAEDQALPESWNGETGDNVLWKTAVPGLAHSSPVVWGNRLFVATAVSSDPNATFRPGNYGDGDHSEDRSTHRWMLLALDKRDGSVLWERVAAEGVPVDKRHIKSTYASATPATDGRVVVASFGSQGLFAYSVDGRLLWSADVGRMLVGAYNAPNIEWGPASSPMIWQDRVFVQVDDHGASFIAAFDLETGRILWQTDRDELPSWGTPNVLPTPAGPQLVTNAANFIRGYDPNTGAELWRLGGSSRITAPTPIAADGLLVVASGRAPERPIFAIRPDAHGDITLPDGERQSAAVAWSWRARGPYMPTPLAYDGILYVLANNGVFDAYDIATGEEIYRQRLPDVASGFSASPVAADGRIYLLDEDGHVVVVRAGRTFEHLGTFPMGELLMATPALSQGVMYVRSHRSVFAIGRR